MEKCDVCLEKFLSSSVRYIAGESVCLRCARDKHIPKLYSAANNMAPGPVPCELQVCDTCIHAYKVI